MRRLIACLISLGVLYTPSPTLRSLARLKVSSMIHSTALSREFTSNCARPTLLSPGPR